MNKILEKISKFKEKFFEFKNNIPLFKKNILEYKNKIIYGLCACLVIVFSIFMIKMFVIGSSDFVDVKYSTYVGKKAFINDELFVYNVETFMKFDKNGKLKLEKNIKNNGKVLVNNGIIYSLDKTEFVIYNSNFQKVKSIPVEGMDLEFFIENDKVVLVEENGFKVYDASLKLLYEKQTNGHVIYVKFSNDGNNLVYSEYIKSGKKFKTRYNVVNIKDKKNKYGFTLYNEFMIDIGFVKKSNKKLYVLTNDKLYIFDEDSVKKHMFIGKIKDFSYVNGKFYLLSNTLDVYNLDLKLDKKITVDEKYNKLNVLNSKFYLSNAEEYVEYFNGEKKETVKMNIEDVILYKGILYFISENGYRKVR